MYRIIATSTVWPVEGNLAIIGIRWPDCALGQLARLSASPDYTQQRSASCAKQHFQASECTSTRQTASPKIQPEEWLAWDLF